MGKKYEFPNELKEDAETINKTTKSRKDRFKDFLNGLPLELNENENIKANSTQNIKLILTGDPIFKGAFAWNDFRQTVTILRDVPEVLVKKGQFKDLYRDMIIGYIEEHYHTLFKKDIFMSGLKQAAVKQLFNPVTDKIKAVKWDHKPRVDTFFIDYLGARNTNFIKKSTRKWLVGAVARAFEPGVKLEITPVLIGKQGLGKSTLCESLNPEYFLDGLPSLNGSNKDNLMLIADNWIIEISELSAINRTSIEDVKKFLSAKNDKFKAPYATVVEEHPRQCAFIGTTNESEFLKDKTGNRRFIPIDCGVIKPTRDVHNISKDYILQLLAEAYELYKVGERFYLNDEELKELSEIQNDNLIEDPLEEAVNDYINMPVPTDWNEYTIFQRRSYFGKYKDSGKVTDRKLQAIPESRLTTMEKVISKEILQVVLNVQDEKLVSASRGGDGKRVSLIMNNNEEWERKGAIRFHDKNARGWRRVNKIR